MGSRLRSFNFPVIFVSFCFSSNRLTVLQDRVHCYVPFWRTMAPRTVWSRKADSRRSFSLKLEFYTEISTHVFHSKNQLIWISRQNMRTANVSIIFKTYQMISKFHLYFRTDVESYFAIGQLHVIFDPSTNQRLDALQFHFFSFRAHARAPISARW